MKIEVLEKTTKKVHKIHYLVVSQRTRVVLNTSVIMAYVLVLAFAITDFTKIVTFHEHYSVALFFSLLLATALIYTLLFSGRVVTETEFERIKKERGVDRV